MYRVLDLFSGIGGFSLGLERTGGFKTVAFCEIDPYCRKVLGKHWPGVPCHDDITTREFVEGEADVITGGFPCQDLSFAGRGAGLTGSRSGLYRELIRAIRLVRPLYAIVENVAALLSRGLGSVLGDLAEVGYDAEWDCISANDLGAPHGRDRVWITLTDSNEFKRKTRLHQTDGRWFGGSSEVGKACNADSEWKLQPPRLLGNIRRRIDNAVGAGAWWTCDWKTKFEAFRRMDDGISTGLDRIDNVNGVKALGNAVVPQIPELIGRAILEAEKA